MSRFDVDDDDVAPAGGEVAPAYVVPYEVMEKSVAGDRSAQSVIAKNLAKKLLDERELAYRLNEGQLT